MGTEGDGQNELGGYDTRNRPEDGSAHDRLSDDSLSASSFFGQQWKQSNVVSS